MGRPLDPKVDHRISLHAAAAETRRYRHEHKPRITDCGAYNAKPVLELLAQEGCVGIRFYRGRSEKGEETLVLVGVNGDGNDMDHGILLQGHFPCPPFCSDDDDLNS